MADDESKLAELVTRGFASLNEQLRERDKEFNGLSEKIIRMEGILDSLKATIFRVETDVSRAETERVKMRVDNLETANSEVKKKQLENAKWIKGLLASVILLLLGFLFNFLRISFKQ